MKKLAIIIFLIAFGIFSYTYIKNTVALEIPKVEIESEKINISKYYIYSSYLNLSGSFDLSEINYDDVKLTLYDGNYKDYDINYDVNGTRLTFSLSEELNRGLYLDDIKKGTYYLFLKITYKNYDDIEEDEDKIVKYYALDNNTEYEDTSYYTMSKYNNKITINSSNEYPTMMLNVENNKDEDTVDIMIDPGHGGMDGGAEAFGSCERDFTYKLAHNIGDKLKALGYKIGYTREEVDKDVLIEEYNEHGRAVLPAEKHAKYLLSIHFNSSEASYVNGLEIYIPIGINYTFAQELVKNITTDTSLELSTRKTYKLEDGIYGHNFTKEDIEASLTTYDRKGYTPYDIKSYSSYYYMIRETGGIVTGAYVDDKNEKVGYNPYYNSNVGTESYVLELGYITNEKDIEIIRNNHDEIANAIANAVKNSNL